MPPWSAAAWGCCYWEASCAAAWGNFSEKSLETAWGKPISLLSWTSRAATGFPARISQDPHSARGLDSADYPLQVQLRCPGLLSAEPFSRSTLYSWQQSRATWFPGLLPVIASLRVRGNVRRSRSDPAAVSSFGRLPQSLGGDGAGCVEEASAVLRGSLWDVTPPLRIPCQRSLRSSRGKGTWREGGCTSTALSALQSSLLNYWN